MCKGENQRHLHHTPGEQMLAFWCQHESVLALQREQYKESHCLERKKKKKQGCKKIGKWVSAPPPKVDLQVCVEGSKSQGFYFTPTLAKGKDVISIHPFIHLFIHSPLCQTLGLVLEALGSGDRRQSPACRAPCPRWEDSKEGNSERKIYICKP